MTRRILLAVVVVTVLAIGAFLVPAAAAIRSAQERGDLLELQREASVVASRVPAVGPIDATVLRPIVDSEHRLGLYGPDGELLGGIGPPTADVVVRTAIDGDFAEGRVGDDLVAAVPIRALVDGSNLVLRIEQPASDSRARFLRSMLELAAAAVAIVLLASVVALALARRINRPIEELRAWAAAPLGERDPPAATGMAELDALRGELLADRERIGELLQRERSFSSQVSHQLRTPVAALRVAVEAELDRPRPDPAEVLHESLGQLDRLESTITGLLALARHDDRPVEEFDLAGLVAEVLRRHPHRPGDRGRRVDVEGGPCRVRADRVAVEHVVDVLVDNAHVHGAGVVRIAVERGPATASVVVADEGESPDSASVFSERRVDGGHGIGLRLARTLAESVGGSLALTEAPTTTFRFELPLEPAGPPTFT